jgi:hypothetical protein
MTKETFDKAEEMYGQIRCIKFYMDHCDTDIAEGLNCSERLTNRLKAISDQTKDDVVEALETEIELLEAEIELL